MPDLETRLRRLERRNAALSLLAVAGLLLAAASWLTGPAFAQPKPESKTFDSVKADELLVKDVEAESIYLTQRIIFRDKAKKPVASIQFGPDGEPAILMSTDDDKVLITPSGFMLNSKKTKTSVAISKSQGNYKVIVHDKDGKIVTVPPSD